MQESKTSEEKIQKSSINRFSSLLEKECKLHLLTKKIRQVNIKKNLCCSSVNGFFCSISLGKLLRLLSYSLVLGFFNCPPRVMFWQGSPGQNPRFVSTRLLRHRFFFIQNTLKKFFTKKL